MKIYKGDYMDTDLERKAGLIADIHKTLIFLVLAFLAAFVLWLQLEYGMAEILWKLIF